MDIIPSTFTGNQEPVDAYRPKPQPATLSKPYLISQFILSLLVFGAAWYFLVSKNIELIAWLAIILIIHELGHYLAMRIFKYEDLAIFFIPLLGAAAQGSKEKISQKEKSIVLLAGPVPGIIIGFILFLLEDQLPAYLPSWLSYAFILVNIFNLLPIYPLDGGQLFRNLFLPDRDILSIIFILLSMGVVTWYALKHEEWYLLIITYSLLGRLIFRGSVSKVRKRLDALEIDYRKTYSELPDEDYWRIRGEMRYHSFYANVIEQADANPKKEKQVINLIREILMVQPLKDLSAFGKLLVLAVWLASAVMPFILVDRIWNIL